MKIQIDNRQKSLKIKKLNLRKVAQKILSVLGCPDAELSIVVVDDDEIRELNREYLGKDRPTNVISFSMQEGEGMDTSMLGDVVISADTAARDAEEGGASFESELYFLLLHGILHLCGYDHERGSDEDARLMEAKEREVFPLLAAEFLTKE